MATSSISYTGSTYDYYSSSSSQLDIQKSYNSSSSSSDTAFGADIREKVNALLADIPRNSNGTLTFEAVMEYRDSLLEDFETRVKADLDALGVDTERDMTFSFDATTDTLVVDSDHPDKAVIDQYFTENDEARQQFAQVLALNKMTQSAERKLSLSDLRTELQVQSMAWWTEANAGNVFSSGNLLSVADDQSESLFFGLDMVV